MSTLSPSDCVMSVLELQFNSSLHVCGVWVSLQQGIRAQIIESYTKEQKYTNLVFSVCCDILLALRLLNLPGNCIISSLDTNKAIS